MRLEGEQKEKENGNENGNENGRRNGMRVRMRKTKKFISAQKQKILNP